jgi:UDPglucose 6-dehydrogenase
MRITIIGAGFVGSAIKYAYDIHHIPVNIHDPAKDLVVQHDTILKSTAIFVCVPSPAKASGECDTHILEDVLFGIRDTDATIISKVTAPPTVYARLQKNYPNLVHVPEFLMAATASADYIAGTFAIIGGNDRYRQYAEQIVRLAQRRINTVKYCSAAEAALAKYSINTFLAMKVTYMNQLHDIAKALDMDFNNLTELMKCDQRLGTSHFQVPGPDGLRGYGGACFPKDIKALISEAKCFGIDMNTLTNIEKYNTHIRKT